MGRLLSRASAREVVLGAAALCASVCGCQQEAPEDRILIEARTEAPIETLQVALKHIDLADEAHIYEPLRRDIDRRDSDYVGAQASRPLQVLIDVPGPGYYLVHLVGEGGATRQTSTTCYAVTGITTDERVGLALLDPTNDVDGDTFPEDLDAYCAARAGAGFSCETQCAGPFAGAQSDCNDPTEIPEAGCPAPPPDAQVNPIAREICGNCYDEDCDGVDPPCGDADGDGYPENVDCDDTDPSINPGVEESAESEATCGNGVDDNCRDEGFAGCDGDVPCDLDGDGYYAARSALDDCGGDDCDDGDAAVSPIAYEGAGADPTGADPRPGCDDGIDNNCNGRIDEGCDDDLDRDGLPAESDCNDCDSGIGQDLPEACGDGIDEDCDGEDLACAPDDADGDGYRAVPAGDDCDDGDEQAHPGAPDRCGDGVAQDCVLDVSCSGVIDLDGDLYASGDDCDDEDASVHPWAEEVCDSAGRDEDCDGQVNEVLDPEARSGCGIDASTGLWATLVYESDLDHCGRCRHRCEITPCWREGGACEAGECRCEGGEACGGDVTDYCCDGLGCRDLTSVTDCGECGHSCVQGEECRPTGTCGRGQCYCPGSAGACPSDPCWVCCPDVGCVDVCTDDRHCGDCDTDCRELPHPPGDICSEGRCYCGRRGTTCAGDAWCTIVTEPEGESCGCADLETDPDNCGACGVECSEGESCSASSCACGASAGCLGTRASYCCPPDGCVSIDTDERHCGGCGRACEGPEECRGGVCYCGSAGGPCLEGEHCCPDGVCRQCCDDSHCTDQACCGGFCRDCCDDGDCVGSEHCCDHSCQECCEDGHCSPGETCCPTGLCGECCEDRDCTGGDHCCDGLCRDCCSDSHCSSPTDECCSDGTCQRCCSDRDCSWPDDECCDDRRCHQCCVDADCILGMHCSSYTCRW